MSKKQASSPVTGMAEAAEPHYFGHRERLRTRFRDNGADSLADYELLELVLFRAIPRRDVKELAKNLIRRFGSFAEVLGASPARLMEIDGVRDAVVTELKIVEAAAQRYARGAVNVRTVLSSWAAVMEYCRTAMVFEEVEQFRVLFLDKKNGLIADEVLQRGTIDHAPVYPREVVRRALELSAAAVILLHNHPTGDPTPSRPDIDMTQTIIAAARTVGISVLDHIIIARSGHTSFKALKLL